MPVEFLKFSPFYVLIGFYRLITDKNLNVPIYKRSSSSLIKSLLISIPLILISYPLTRFYVVFILSRSPFSPKRIHDAIYFGITPSQYTTVILILGQISYLFEFMLRNQLKKSKLEVYQLTVKSRAKGDDFFRPYVEEWLIPPTERAERALLRETFMSKMTGPLFRYFVLKILLQPLSFIPFLGLVVGAGLSSLSAAKNLHKPYFQSKHLTPFQTSLFLTERLTSYRLFGFTSSLLERIPLIGIIFSISNRVGAAMMAFDLEKLQHRFERGEIERSKVYLSSNSSSSAAVSGSGNDTGGRDGEGEKGEKEMKEMIGGFPSRKGPVAIGRDGNEIGLASSSSFSLNQGSLLKR